MTAFGRATLWFLIGVAAGAFLVATQARAVGGHSGILAVGEVSRLRPIIEQEIEGLVLVPGEGNDGQIYYAISLDLAGNFVPQQIQSAELRYQRITYPALAGLGGLLGGQALLWGMILLSVVALGLTTGALSVIVDTLGLSRWSQAGVLLNPGIWLAVRQLTPDILAVALALVGTALVLQGRWQWGTATLILSSLTKESLVLIAVGLAIWLTWERRWLVACLVAGLPATATYLWSWVARIIADGSAALGGENWSPPFRGIIRAANYWPLTPLRERVMTGVAIALILVGITAFLISKSRLARSLLLPWLILPIVTSESVWRFGNGSLRGFGIVGVLGALALASRWGAHRMIDEKASAACPT